MAFITIYDHGNCKRIVVNFIFFKLQAIIVDEEVYQKECESLLE